MSDQTLREALEKRLATLPVMAHDNGYLVGALPKAELLGLLAAHPAEPAPIQEQGDAGGRAFDDPDRAELAEVLGAVGVRMILDHPADPVSVGVEITDEAASRAAWVFAELKSQAWLTFSEETRGRIAASWVPTARAALVAAQPFMTRRPALDREAVESVVLDEFAGQGGLGLRVLEHGARRIADAVLALLDGGAK